MSTDFLIMVIPGSQHSALWERERERERERVQIKIIVVVVVVVVDGVTVVDSVVFVVVSWTKAKSCWLLIVFSLHCSVAWEHSCWERERIPVVVGERESVWAMMVQIVGNRRVFSSGWNEEVILYMVSHQSRLQSVFLSRSGLEYTWGKIL